MSSELSWRIPTTGDPRLLRIGLAQVGLASIVAALILIVAAPRDWLVPALVGLIPLALFMAYRRWRAFHRSMTGTDNVRLDEAGLHWIDAAGQDRCFRRDEITDYRIGTDEETLRRVPALTLQLASGFESQPIELHEPATPDVVRQWLTNRWHIVQRGQPEEAAPNDYHEAVCIYSECDEDFQQWHWEGTNEELARFFGQFSAAAHEFPPPPPGAKPRQRIVVTSRRAPSRLRLAHAAVCHFEPDILAAPASVLHHISTKAAELLKTASEQSDMKFDVPLATNNCWTFHLHVRAP